MTAGSWLGQQAGTRDSLRSQSKVEIVTPHSGLIFYESVINHIILHLMKNTISTYYVFTIKNILQFIDITNKYICSEYLIERKVTKYY